jgi:hypothetical protein
MTTAAIFVDTLFFYPAALTTAGTTSTCIVSDQDTAGSTNVGFQVTVATIGTNVVVRFEGSLDGTNFFNLGSGDFNRFTNCYVCYFCKIKKIPCLSTLADLMTRCKDV